MVEYDVILLMGIVRFRKARFFRYISFFFYIIILRVVVDYKYCIFLNIKEIKLFCILFCFVVFILILFLKM